MPRRLTGRAAELFARQHGVASRQQLLQHGVGARTIATWVRHGLLHQPVPGALVDVSIWDAASDELRHTMHLYAVQLVAPDVVARSVTSVLTWALPVRSIPVRPLVVRDLDSAPLRAASVQRRRLDGDQLCVRSGLRTLTLAHSVVDVAATVPLPDALITIDAALRRGLHHRELVDAITARGHFRGCARARFAIAAGDPGAESALESISRGRVIERELPLPLCNVVITYRGRSARVDKLWTEDGVVGEADGLGKYKGLNAQQVIWKEKRRHDWLEELGCAVVRWGMPEVGDDGLALERRYLIKVAHQRAIGFTWQDGVRLTVPKLPGVPLPDRVLREVERLAAAGYPIDIAPSQSQSGESSALWTPRSA